MSYLQCLPCGGGGGGWLTASEKERAWSSRLLSFALISGRESGQSRRRSSSLLHRRASSQQPSRSHAIHRGGQPHLQWLLEHSPGPEQELSHLFAGSEQLQRGEWVGCLSQVSDRPNSFGHTRMQTIKKKNLKCKKWLMSITRYYSMFTFSVSRWKC